MSGGPDTYQREIISIRNANVNSYSAGITSYSIEKDLPTEENMPKDYVFLPMWLWPEIQRVV